VKKKEFIKPQSVRELAFFVGSYTAGSILGPLLIFGGIGFFLDKIFNTRPLILIIGVLVAFLATNFLIYKKLKKMMKQFDNAKNDEHVSKKID